MSTIVAAQHYGVLDQEQIRGRSRKSFTTQLGLCKVVEQAVELAGASRCADRYRVWASRVLGGFVVVLDSLDLTAGTKYH